MPSKNIVAIGGGGFGRSLGSLEIEKYIVSLSNKKRPKICFIPTASGDSSLYKLNFYRAFSKLDCITSHIDFFSRTENLEEKVLTQDIIYVGGGNTKSMLAVWKEWNLHKILRNAYEKGIVMSGVSAGAICWFDKGITDSYAKELAIIDCLGIVEGIACPHFDEEKEREPYVNDVIQREIIESCICIEGNCALHIKNDFDYSSIDFGNGRKCFRVTKENNIIKKEILMIPFFGWAIARLKPISINRKMKIESLRKIIEEGGARIQQGYSILIFPEGTRKEPKDGIGKFGNSCGLLASNEAVPIVPICHNSGKYWLNKSFKKTILFPSFS